MGADAADVMHVTQMRELFSFRGAKGERRAGSAKGRVSAKGRGGGRDEFRNVWIFAVVLN